MPLPRPVRAAILAPYLAVFYPFLVLRRAASALRPGRTWRTWITPQVLLGGFLVASDVAELERLGIGAVVNVSRELLDPVGALRRSGIEYLRVPAWDTRAPALEAASRGVRFIARHVGEGRRVYIHCASGVGRSVALTICYLAAHEGHGVEDALEAIRRLRPRVAMRPIQRAFVERFLEHYRAELVATAQEADSARCAG